MPDAVWVALIVGIGAVVGPLILSIINGRQADQRELRANARQDKVAAQAEKTALVLQQSQARIAEQVAATADQAAEAARLLVVNNAVQADAARDQSEKLNVIHGLVNSSLTTAMNGELSSTIRELALMKLVAGSKPDADAKSAIEITQARIDELTLTIADRNVSAAAVAAEAAKVGLTEEDGPAR